MSYIDPLDPEELARQQQSGVDELTSSTYDNHGISNNPTPWQQILIPVLGWAGGMAAGAILGGGAAAGGGAAETAATAIPSGAVASLPSAAPVLGAVGAGSGVGLGATASKVGLTGLSSILSGAAGARGAAQDVNNDYGLRLAQYRLTAPQQRLRTAVRAGQVASATPVKAEWGGPGSGMKGQTVHYTGGYSTPLDPALKASASQMMSDQMEQQLKGDGLPEPGHSSLLDNLLGYGALGTGIAGAVGGIKKKVSDPNTPNWNDYTDN